MKPCKHTDIIKCNRQYHKLRPCGKRRRRLSSSVVFFCFLSPPALRPPGNGGSTQGGTRPTLRKKTYENSLRDRDREKVDAEFLNETRLSDFSMSETRLRRDLTQNSRQDQDETESLGVFFYKTEMRTNF